MKVPFVDLTREWDFFEKSFLKKFKELGRSGHYVLGEYGENLEKHFADFCGYKYAVAVSTGLTALETALRSCNIGVGDEVITVGNSAVATSLAISYTGAKPVFCDVGDDFLIDVNLIEAQITNKTKAILPVHLFGRVCNMEKINEIAVRHNLVVIEDACQAHGADFAGASLTNTKAFSFYPTKNLGAIGEGGMVVTNDEKVRDFISAYRNYGQAGRYNHIMKGNNYRLAPLQSCLLDTKLPHLTDFVAKRRSVAERYIKDLSTVFGIQVSKFETSSAYHLFVIRVLNGKRDELKTYLFNKGIEALVHYPTPIHCQPCYADEYKNVVLKNTDKLQTEILSLPCYPFIKEKEQTYVINSIKDFFHGKV